jgi:hypothetical protein
LLCTIVFFKALLSTTYNGNPIGGNSFYNAFL